MDGLVATGLSAAFAGGVGTGLIIGLRVIGTRLSVAWTEVHPREIAADVQAGRIKWRELAPESQRLVLAEMARMANGLTAAESAEFLAVTGVADRFVGQPQPAWAQAKDAAA